MPDASLINSSLIMLLVAGVLALLLFFIKRSANNRIRNGNGVQMQVVSKLTLQPKVNLYVVKTGGRMIMLGVSDKNVSLLGDLVPSRDKAVELSALQQETLGINQSGQIVKTKPTEQKANSESLSFASFLMSIFKRHSNN